MTYSTKAEVFSRALTETGSIEEALRAADVAARRPGRPPRITPEQRSDLRRRRAAGASTKELGAEFGISASYASVLTQGVALPVPAPETDVSLLAAALGRHIGEQLGLPSGWLSHNPRGRWPRPQRLGQRAFILAMRAGGEPHRAIGRALGQQAWMAVRKLRGAKYDAEARTLARKALAAVLRGLTADLAEIAAPAPAPEHRAA